MGGGELSSEAASREGEWNVDEKSQPLARYRPCWDPELAEANAPNIARTIRLCFLVDAVGSATGMLIFPIWSLLTETTAQPFFTMYEAQSWGLVPQVTNIVLALLVYVAFSLPQLKGFVTHNYMAIVSVVCTIVWNCWVLSSAMHDPSRPNKGALRSWAEQHFGDPFHIHHNMTFGFRLASNGMPVNNCSDSAPMWTLRKYGDVQVEPGCLSLMGDGNRLGIFMLFCQAGVWGRVLPWTAVRLMSLNAVIYVVICLAIGFNKQTFVMQVLMFAVAGGACALQCHLLDRQTKHAFALHKINGFVHQSSYCILRTLIPPNVLAEFSKRCVDPGHREGGDDGAGAGGRREEEVEQELNMRRHQPLREAVAIKHCTIMVCSLRFSVANVHDFELVSQLFRAYDEAVWESGMFKYQHVAQGPIHYYIVGCPRIACPYDLEQHRAAYPHEEYCRDMLLLAAKLQEITNSVQAAILVPFTCLFAVHLPGH
eukprot:Tamp_06618.p1 GENE.Tamp_06618~~Tamp_06618.p1  ORF type:complete len:483 (+),score=74.13 Tamp_06618:525-1973(+)